VRAAKFHNVTFRMMIVFALVSATFLSVISCSASNASSVSKETSLSATPLEGDFSSVVYSGRCTDGFFMVSEDSENLPGSQSIQMDRYDSDGNPTAQYPLQWGMDSGRITLFSDDKTDAAYFLTARSTDSLACRYEVFSFSLKTGEVSSVMSFDLDDFSPVSMACTSENVYVLGDDDRLVTVDKTGRIASDKILDDDCRQLFLYKDRLLIEAGEANSPYLLLQDEKKPDDFAKIDASYLAENSCTIDGNLLYYCSRSGIYCTDPVSGETTKISNWLFMIDRILPDSRISVLSISADSFLVRVADQGRVNSAVYYLAGKCGNDSSQPAQTITIAGFAISSDPCVLKAIETFNANHTSVKAVIRDYYDGVEAADDFDKAYENAVREMKLDILSGNSFDVFCGSAAEIKIYANSDVYENLNNYLAVDDEFDPSLYLENALYSAETDGNLLYLFPSFGVSGLVGASSVIGERSSWTMDEFREIASSQNSDVHILPAIGYSSLLSIMASSAFYDLFSYNANSMSISEPVFSDMLSFAKTYGLSENEAAAIPYSQIGDLLAAGKIMTVNCNIRGASYYMREEYAFGGPVSITNYPSINGTVPSFDPSKCYAISTGSNHKAAAWEFIKTTLEKEVQIFESANDSIPVMSSVFEDDIRNAKIETPNGVISMSNQSAQRYRSLIKGLHGINVSDNRILSIICEESAPYFYGDKSEDDIFSIIQNRVSILLEE